MMRNKAWTKEYKREYEKQYHFKNKERINKNARDRRVRNAEKFREYDRQWWAKNKEKYWQHNLSPERQERRKEIWKKSHIKNNVKRNKYSHEWNLKNKESVARYNQTRINPQNRERYRGYWRAAMKRRIADPNRQIRHNLRVRMGDVLKGLSKSASTMKLVGCTIEELWKHLESSSSWESWMTRENYGAGGWDLDHIKACAKFDLTDPEQQRVCFHWSNLQPLEHMANLKKSNR